MRVAGLFSGIGGLELAFHQANFETILMCELDPMCRAVLSHRFPGVDLRDDIRSITQLPRAEIVVAGFPCQPYSQAGPTPGLSAGKGLLREMMRLIAGAKVLPRYVVLENVKNILHLANGEALRSITRRFESLGYTWAYRLVDTNAFGIPQRRQRWIFVASLNETAPAIMFAHEPEVSPNGEQVPAAHGFYWTEGNRGLGWADNAIPPLKGGSNIGIPSPPAIWIRANRSIVTPHVRDAERLQGFPPGWTDVPDASTYGRFERFRWKMVGNAVSVPTASWIAGRIQGVGPRQPVPLGKPFRKAGPWPKAAWGAAGVRYAIAYQTFRSREAMTPILEFLSEQPTPLSLRATQGFRLRLEASSLRYPREFVDDLAYHEGENSFGASAVL